MKTNNKKENTGIREALKICKTWVLGMAGGIFLLFSGVIGTEAVAACNNCGHQILITEITKGIAVLPSKIRGLAERQGCLICQDSNLLVEYICDNGSKDCIFFARCIIGEHYMIISAKGIQHLFR